jgi:hypothetical protein
VKVSERGEGKEDKRGQERAENRKRQEKGKGEEVRRGEGQRDRGVAGGRMGMRGETM